MNRVDSLPPISQSPSYQNIQSSNNMNYNNMGGYGAQPMMGSVMSPIVEPGRERVVNRTFVHEVPQV